MAIENVCENAINLFNGRPSGYLVHYKYNTGAPFKSIEIVTFIVHQKIVCI